MIAASATRQADHRTAASQVRRRGSASCVQVFRKHVAEAVRASRPDQPATITAACRSPRQRLDVRERRAFAEHRHGSSAALFGAN